MQVLAVGGKAFFHKDILKTFGFKWYREAKVWVAPVGTIRADDMAMLSDMNGIVVRTCDHPCEHLYPKLPWSIPDAIPEAPESPVSSLDKVRAAMTRVAASPAHVEADASPDGKFREIAQLLRQLADKIESL